MYRLQVFARRGGESENAKVPRPLHQFLDDDDVGVISGGFVRLVDDEAFDVAVIDEPAVQIVAHHLRREEEDPLLAPPAETNIGRYFRARGYIGKYHRARSKHWHSGICICQKQNIGRHYRAGN